MKLRYLVAIVFLGMASLKTFANTSLTDEPNGNTYNFVSNHRVEIKAAKEDVWSNLIDFGSWMYDFEMAHHSGERSKVGEILRLYPEQDFFVQITGMVQNESLVLANLPSTFNGEESTGIAVISLSETNQSTVVHLTMSRRYSWIGEGENVTKQRRLSQQFIDNTNATWGRFLEKLRALSEGA